MRAQPSCAGLVAYPDSADEALWVVVDDEIIVRPNLLTTLFDKGDVGASHMSSVVVVVVAWDIESRRADGGIQILARTWHGHDDHAAVIA